MTAVALLAANLTIGSARPRQREALIEILIFGDLYRSIGKGWISRPMRPVFGRDTITALISQNMIYLHETDRRPGEQWARLTDRGRRRARCALNEWVALVDSLVNDAELAGLVAGIDVDLGERLAKLEEWHEEKT